jgi:hypothetical protein
MSLKTPVAFFIFNRPDLTEIVFEAIAEAKPTKLFVIADAAAKAEDEEKCKQCRDIIERVDWDCEVIKKYPEQNIGARDNVPTGVQWVFSQVEECIFLEDDCLPDPSFFSFCETLLEYYRDDERIMHINGGNFLFNQVPLSDSYYFSRYMFTGYGWASWRRAWKYYDLDMRSLPDFEEKNLMSFVFDDQEEQAFWTRKFREVYTGELISYCYPIFFAGWSQSGLSIMPSVNLVSNLGFRADAVHTNTAYERMYLANIPRSSIGEIIHPKHVIRHRDADRYLFQIYFGSTGTEKSMPTGLRYYWVALKYKLGQLQHKLDQLRSSA